MDSPDAAGHHHMSGPATGGGPQQARQGVGHAGVGHARDVPHAQVRSSPGAEMAQLGAAQTASRSFGGHAQHGPGTQRWPHQGGDLEGQAGVGQEMPAVVASSSAGAQADGDAGIQQGGQNVRFVQGTEEEGPAVGSLVIWVGVIFQHELD